MCWIDVKNQLPEDGAVVDVFVGGRRVPDIIYSPAEASTLNAGIQEKAFLLPGYIDDLDQAVVTHWRYPPEPPVRGA